MVMAERRMGAIRPRRRRRDSRRRYSEEDDDDDCDVCIFDWTIFDDAHTLTAQVMRS